MGKRDDLEGRLRDGRAEAPAALVENLSAGEGRPKRSSWRSRAAFGAAITVMMLGTFGSLGGLSYAASGGSSAFRTLERVATAHKVVVQHSSAKSQYPTSTKPKATHIKRHHHSAKHGTLAAVHTKGTLPFTGFSLLGTVLVSLMLVGAGVMLRRREQRS